jgi:putative PIN family toxin of toxin-antitoxin system
LKAVFDTNIYISAFAIPGGKAEEVFLQVMRGAFTLFTSVAILTEVAQKLRNKFGWEEERIIELLRFLRKIAQVLKTHPTLTVLKDEPDNRILDCAEEAHADYIVTGDKHLLRLKKYKNIMIVNLADFLDMIKEL